MAVRGGAPDAARPLGATAGLGLLLLSAGAAAQDGACRLVDSTSGPPRQILTCPAGPSIEAEQKADVHVQDTAGQGHPASATIGSGAALIDVPLGYPGGFQILTPRAVASVRGTIWAVDVGPAQTSVFVVRGQVAVRRAAGGPEVALRKGEGVDVRDGGEPLRVTRWPPRRAAALLARFGR